MFTLDYRSRKPLYDQLCQSIERMAACGVLEPGSHLPSVRMLAEELAINPNTVQKAYRMLEHSGVIETVPGKGSFLCAGDRAKQLQKNRSRQALRAGIQAALDAGMTPAEIRQEGEAYLRERGTKCL